MGHTFFNYMPLMFRVCLIFNWPCVKLGNDIETKQLASNTKFTANTDHDIKNASNFNLFE